MTTAERERWRAACAELAARTRARFDALAAWSAADARLAEHRPAPGAWTVREVLEHVALADRCLLVLAQKIAQKSARRALAGAPWPAHPPRFEHLARLSSRELVWRHPAHMTPSGAGALADHGRRLRADRDACLALLAAQPAGEGTLHVIRMSVVGGDDRLDLYQYIECLGLHARRHLAQLERNAASAAQNP